MLTRETEIRHLSSADIYKLAQILDLDNKWRKLMAIIPKDFDANSDDSSNLKYNNDHVRLVENASIKQNRMATEILLEEWGTSGKKRPTLGVLLELLVKAASYRAADFVAMNFLNEPPPPRPATGPARRIDISIPLDSEFVDNVEEMLNEMPSDFVGTDTLNDNARPSNAADNNIDYYEKYHPNRKHIEVPQQINDAARPSTENNAVTQETDTGTGSLQRTTSQSDFIKFSASSVTTSQVIPNLSELMPSSSNHAGAADTSSVQSMDIPMLSVLNTNTQQQSEEMLPNLSALNVEDAELDFDKLRPPEESASVLSSSSVSSLSSTGDDDDLSAPNLSILDQRSSNNDSSLTNVTGTSEENSSEISMNEEAATSNDNIPCLSALK